MKGVYKMRELKFRAWDRFNKRMLNVNNLANEGSFIVAYKNRGDSIGLSDIEADIMQYTGIKDINGKEIFESDILSWQDGYLNEHINAVAWSDKSLWWALNYEGEFVESLSRAELPEVVGNIYENPELVKPITQQ